MTRTENKNLMRKSGGILNSHKYSLNPNQAQQMYPGAAAPAGTAQGPQLQYQAAPQQQQYVQQQVAAPQSPFVAQSVYQQQYQQPQPSVHQYQQYIQSVLAAQAAQAAQTAQEVQAVQAAQAAQAQLPLPQHYQQQQQQSHHAQSRLPPTLSQLRQPQPAGFPAQPPAQQPAHAGSYSDQVMSAYYNYQQQQLEQQRQQQQMQQRLLHQLYQQPRLGEATAVDGGSVPQTQYQATYQPHHRQHQGSNNGLQYYSTQQHANYLQNQQQSVLNDQFNNVHQSFMGRAHSNLNAPPTLAVYNSTLPSTNNPVTMQYSPADKVSQVKYSSNNLNYNF